MPKKPPPNGYYFFMLDFKRREERQGRRFPGGMQDVSKAASDDWNSLPPSEKARYNKIAKDRKNDPRPNVPKPDEKKFNSQGVSFAELKREKNREEEKLELEKNFISSFVGEMTLDDLRHKLIHLIHVNIFCKTDADVYYPAEIAIVKFSLKDGVKKVFHRFIDPGDIAKGYSYAVKEHSELTHKLTLPYVKSVGLSDLERLYHEIHSFLTDYENDSGRLPPLFTMYDDVIHNTSIKAVRYTLKNLWETVHPSHDQDDDHWERVYKILPLPDMFYRLKNKCMQVEFPNQMAFPNAIFPKMELEKDTYHYEATTACKFHRGDDNISHCSKSFVLRWAFIIRDHCTDLIGVDLFENVVPKSELDEEDEDDTSSLVSSFHSINIGQASIGSSIGETRTKQEVAGCSERSKMERNEGADEYGGIRCDSNSPASIKNTSGYAATSHASRGKDNFSVSSSIEDNTQADCDSEANQSIKSCPVAWPNVNRRPQNVPIMNENNFPSLGRGRGSLRNLRRN